MSRCSFVFWVVAVLGCKECPECPCLEGDTSAKTVNNSETKEDGESDAGVTPSAIGGKPSPVTAYDLHGRAGFMRVNVFEKPDMDSPRLGYLRKGQRIRVGDPKFSSESCPKGWFQLPDGGFVCQGRGMLVGTKPRFIPRPPPPGRFDELDPFRHGFIRKDWTPAYKRIPAEEEIWTAPTREMGDNPDGGPPPVETLEHDPDEADGGVDYYKYTKRKFRNVKEMMSRGFWISVGARRFDEATRRFYYETTKGDFVPAENVHLVKPPTFKGYEVTGETPFPAAIVRDRHASFFSLRKERFRGIGPVERLSTYRVYETKVSQKVSFYKIEGDRWLKSTQVAYFELTPPPEGVKGDEQWIRVNLTQQTLVAYEGTMPVYATLVSTGLPDSEETVTPRGKFRVSFKHLTDDMAGSIGDNEDVYLVQDVPWVQYIHRNVALHASFWHSSYGSPKSHGCINLAPADARWLFNWSHPKLPDGWHAVIATDKTPGTLVIVEGKTPAK